jgi:glutamate 5-kinase
MSTKIVAARLATSAGVTTIITRSSKPGNIANIVRYLQDIKTTTPQQSLTSTKGEATPNTTIEESLSHSVISEPPLPPPLHTRFIPSQEPIRDRYFWLQYGLAPHGTIYIDAGAHRALINKAGLLPVGIVDVDGTFAQQEAVRLVVVERLSKPSPVTGKLWEGPGVEVGRALVIYSALEIARIKGMRSSEIRGVLGYADCEHVALRENINIFQRESRPVTPSLELQSHLD